MADQPLPEKPPGKVDGKGKEPQKFLYLQLQQDRTGDGTGRVATLVGGRGGTGPAHFIPLTAKLNSISVLGSGPRASRGAMSVGASRTQTSGRKNSSSSSSTAVVTMATGRPVVATAVSVATPTRCGTMTVSSPRPVIASPVTTVAAKSSSSTPIVRKAHTNVMVSSGITRPSSSPNAATITVLGASGGLSGSAPPVLRPNTSQGTSPHPPVILHTSKVPQPSSSPSPGAGKGMSPRLVPIPLTQVRTGVTNKAVLSYSALLQAGAGAGVGGAGLGGAGGGNSSSGGNSSNSSTKKEGHASPQPLLLQATSPAGVKGTGPLAKTGGATISIITGKGGKQGAGVSGGGPKPVNMLAVNLGQTKSNMINFKISNGQIQADNLQPMDAVLRETRPVQAGVKRGGEERKEASKVVAGTALAHAVGSGSVTVSVTGTVPATLKIPEPVIVPVTVPLPPPQSSFEPVSSSVQEQDGLAHLRDVTVTPTRRDKEDLLQKAVSTLGDALEEEAEEEEEEEAHTSHRLVPPLTYTLEEEEEGRSERESGGKMQTIFANSPSQPLSPVGDEETKVKLEDGVVETTAISPMKPDAPPSFITKPQVTTKSTEDIKPELVKFSELLKWEDGVGKLDGSALKFKMNEFNAVEIVEDRDLEELKIQQIKRTEVSSTRHHARKPNYRDIVKDEDIFSDNSQDSEPQGNKGGKESYDICCCKNCGCYGLSSEFFRDSSFCSTACGDEHDARELEWNKERQRQEKERQRRKRLRQSEKAGEEEQAGGEGSDGEEGGSGDDEDKEEEGVSSRFQHPWQDGKSSFSWVKYLEHCGRAKGLAKAAPLKLWPEPFPFGRNLFRMGMKLEAIDPCHQSLFCVMTVAEVIGHRLRLHFDGYSEQHDFWVNADSSNIFPAGWCEKNGRQLEAPLGVLGFSWKAYLEHCKAQAAPRQAFVGKAAPMVVTPNNFRVGMKLEAEDRKNAWVCVATVADVLDNRVLIHFDGWEKAYDVWSEVSSPYIHPVGWCGEASVVLHPPNNYPSPESFNWHEYLQETNSMAVPARAFKTRPPRDFRQGMKVEAVDRRNPSLVRVATVADTHDYQVKVHFDGWGDEYDLWVDDDSPDLHPPSWCAKTCHPLQPPLTPEQQAEDVDAGTGCGTPGCKGVGHVKGPVYTTHHTAYGCPYSLQNLAKDPDAFIADRLSLPPERKKCKAATPKVRLDLRPGGAAKEAATHDLEESDGHKKRVRKRRKFFDELSPPEPNRPQKVPKLTPEDPRAMAPAGPLAPPPSPGVLPQGAMPPNTPAPSTSTGQQPSIVSPLPQQPPSAAVPPPQADPGVDMMVHQSVFNPGYTPHPAPPPPHSWERHRHLTAPLGDARRVEVEAWSPEQVGELVGRIPGCESVATAFTDQQIDGEALLMMTQNDLVSLLHIKLGPAVKIMAVIMCLRNSP